MDANLYVHVSIAQRVSPNLLRAIGEKYATSRVDAKGVYFNRESRLQLLVDIQPFCVVKCRQIHLDRAGLATVYSF